MKGIAWLAWGVLFLSAVSASCDEPPPWAGEGGKVSARDLEVTKVPPAPPSLSLEDALKLGYANNSGFRSSIASLMDSQSRLRVAQQLYDLNVSGSTQTADTGSDGSVTQTSVATGLTYELLTGATVSLSAALDMLDSEQSSALSIGATQPLMRGAGRESSRYEALRSAYASYRRALIQFFLNKQDLALDIITGYFGVVRARDQVGIQEQGLKQAESAVEVEQKRLTEGLTTRIEVARAQLSRDSRRLALTRATLSYQDNVDGFLKTLGLEVGTTPEFTTGVVYKPVTLDTGGLVAEALDKRGELKARELTLEDTSAALRIRRNRRKPSLDLFGSTVQPLSGGNNGTEWTLGIQTQIPINSRSLDEAVREAERAWLVAERDYTELRQSVATQVRQEIHSLESQKATLDILRQTLEVAREKLRLAVISIEEGVGVDRDKIEAQDEVTNAEHDLVDAEISYYFGVLGLRRAVGRDVLAGLAAETTQQPQETPQPAPESPASPGGGGAEK
jgi:outer membrane protein TolC